MKLDTHFFTTPTGQLVLVGLLAAVSVTAVAWQRARREPMPMSRPNVSAPAALPRTFTREGARFVPPASSAMRPKPVKQTAPPPALPQKPRVMPLALVAATPANAERPPVVPYGRLIPCETIVTLESNRLETPVIGLVTEDVWHDGRLVLRAGSEVHGRAALDRSRERLGAQGRWTIIAGEGRTKAVQVDGLALDRSITSIRGEWDDQDGSAGLRGEVVRSDDWRELKLFASTFLSTATLALQETRVSAGLLGENALPAATARNATLAGTSAVLREYAQQLREAIARDGFYVRVPAGTPFYLYVTQPLSLSADEN